MKWKMKENPFQCSHHILPSPLLLLLVESMWEIDIFRHFSHALEIFQQAQKAWWWSSKGRCTYIYVQFICVRRELRRIGFASSYSSIVETLKMCVSSYFRVLFPWYTYPDWKPADAFYIENKSITTSPRPPRRRQASICVYIQENIIESEREREKENWDWVSCCESWLNAAIQVILIFSGLLVVLQQIDEFWREGASTTTTTTTAAASHILFHGRAREA